MTMILESCFNSKLPPDSLRTSLESFAAICAEETFNWNLECFEDADPNLPLSFAVCYPGKTHVATGDTVKVKVLVVSNFDYAIHVSSLTLLTLAGEFQVPSEDLLVSEHAKEGINGGIVILPRTEIRFFTKISIPKDLDGIAVDESWGEKANKSFTKSARPRTAGITAAGKLYFILCSMYFVLRFVSHVFRYAPICLSAS